MRRLVVSILGLSALAGCRGSTFEEPPFAPLRNMFNQPRYEAQSESEFFADGRTMRQPVAHTVSREEIVDISVGQGRTPDNGDYVDEVPVQVVRRMGGLEAMAQRGEDRYGIYCVPCHGGLGDGQGMVTERAANPAFMAPSFHSDKIRSMTDGQLFATITYGFSNMPAYGPQIPVNDRWAIVSYVRALQLSAASNKAE